MVGTSSLSGKKKSDNIVAKVCIDCREPVQPDWVRCSFCDHLLVTELEEPIPRKLIPYFHIPKGYYKQKIGGHHQGLPSNKKYPCPKCGSTAIDIRKRERLSIY